MERSAIRRGASGGLVYSTETGRMCPDCRNALAECTCKANAAPAGDGNVRVMLNTKGRGGKAVTLVKGLALNTDELNALGKQLRSACGSGGTAKEGVLEVQGDHCDRVIAELQGRGFKPKRAGG
jgi:translation initiation factor 1